MTQRLTMFRKCFAIVLLLSAYSLLGASTTRAWECESCPYGACDMLWDCTSYCDDDRTLCNQDCYMTGDMEPECIDACVAAWDYCTSWCFDVCACSCS